MGCCISKCRPQTQSLQLQLQHKLPISKQASSNPNPQYSVSKQISASPLSPISSASSLSSFTCTSSSSTLSSTASSSALTSFSNDFLLSCYQHHPHVLRINSLKQASLSSASPRGESVSHHSANIHINPSPVKPSLGVPQKRVRERPSSPANLTRQKSFRKDPPTPNSSAFYNVPSRTVRSPSPSRRFVNADARKYGGDLTATKADFGVSRRMIGPKANAVSPLIRKQSVKGASSPDNITSRGLHQASRQRQSSSQRIGSKIDETIVKEVVTSADRDMESTFREDIDNPLISLDCFIFL